MVEARSQLRRGNAVFGDTSQLLLIVSDGRCLGDRHKVKSAVRRAQDAQMFLVFIILDNPDKEVGLYGTAAACLLTIFSASFNIFVVKPAYFAITLSTASQFP